VLAGFEYATVAEEKRRRYPVYFSLFALNGAISHSSDCDLARVDSCVPAAVITSGRLSIGKKTPLLKPTGFAGQVEQVGGKYSLLCILGLFEPATLCLSVDS